MSWIIYKREPISTFLILLIFMITWWVCPLWAQDKIETLTIKPIGPPPEFRPYESDSSTGLVDTGKIDQISKEGVVIEDHYREFSSSVVFLSKTRKPISSTRFKAGMYVGFRLNLKGEIIAMWIFERL